MGDRPFAYNTGSTVSGTNQVGSLAVGTGATIDYAANSGTNLWFNGPDESTGYVVAYSATTSSKVQFWRSIALTDQSFLTLVNKMRPVRDLTGFTSASNAYTWINNNGFWTSYTGSSSSDVTPDAVNWSNITSSGSSYGYTTQQITGINTGITLTVTHNIVGPVSVSKPLYKIDTTSPTYSNNQSPGNYGGFIDCPNNTTISISNGQYLTFSIGIGISNAGPSTVTVKNSSDGDVVLDTFVITSVGNGDI